MVAILGIKPRIKQHHIFLTWLVSDENHKSDMPSISGVELEVNNDDCSVRGTAEIVVDTADLREFLIKQRQRPTTICRDVCQWKYKGSAYDDQSVGSVREEL